MIYFDNASTSFPKAPQVSSKVKKFIDEGCFNINRGGYKEARGTAELVFDTREQIAEFFHAKSGKNVAFTGGLTAAINMALKGMLKAGDTVLTSTMEHNAVMRPLSQLEKIGVKVDYFCCNDSGEADLSSFEKKLQQKPKMVITTHASNVCGTIMPITEMGGLCKKYNVFFAVDTAQTAGVVDIDIQKSNIDFLCFTTHKGLLSVQGLGGLIVSDRAAQIIEPLISGGTGSFSWTTEVPKLMPDKLEAGTLNLSGIIGLNSSLEYINSRGIDESFWIEKEIQNYFESSLKDILPHSFYRLVGAKSKNRCAVTSIDFIDSDNGEIAQRLDEEYGIMTRSGMHCAPIAHKTIGSFPKGTVRFSFGHTNTLAEVDVLLNALKKLTLK